MSRSKKDLKSALIQLVESDLATATRAQQTTQAGLTHEDAKPENDKDTRALEQSYLARGQAARVADLATKAAEVRAMPERPFREGERASLGALIAVEEGELERLFFLAPAGGGAFLAGGVQVVTVSSPLGKALLGKFAGDDCELFIDGKKRALSILRIE